MRKTLYVVLVCFVGLSACGDDDIEADKLGIGASCANNDDCNSDDNHQCLPFKGGYCGVPDCEESDDCPEGSACVAHTDGANYCFRICNDKAECNANRGVDEEANCSSSIDFASGEKEGKACVPPS